MKVAITSNSFWNLYNFRLPIIKSFLAKNFKVYLLASKDKYSDYFQDMGCEIIFLNIKKNHMSILSDIILFKDYFFFLKKINPKIIFLFTIKPNIYGSVACSSFKY